MEQELKRHYSLLVEFLGNILGPDYEIALHELKDDSNQIIAIANGELTGRHLGSPLSNKMLEYLTSRLYETQDYVLRFESTSVTGKKMCSNSLFIRGANGELAGLLCINFDSSRYEELAGKVMDLCGGKLVPRKDDDPNTVRDRLAVYHKETEPLKGFYEARGILKTVEDQSTVDGTTQAILRALGVDA